MLVYLRLSDFFDGVFFFMVMNYSINSKIPAAPCPVPTHIVTIP